MTKQTDATGDHQLRFYSQTTYRYMYIVVTEDMTYPQREASTGHGRLSLGVLWHSLEGNGKERRQRER